MILAAATYSAVISAMAKPSANSAPKETPKAVVSPPTVAPPETVTLKIRANKVGPIKVDGHNAGVTPLDFQVPKSATPVFIEVTVDRRTLRRQVIADRDQTVDLGGPVAAAVKKPHAPVQSVSSDVQLSGSDHASGSGVPSAPHDAPVVEASSGSAASGVRHEDHAIADPFLADGHGESPAKTSTPPPVESP